MTKAKLKLVVAATAALMAEIIAPVFSGVAQAAPPPQFTQAFLRLDRHKELVPTGGTICATPSTVSAIYGDFQVTFPTQGTGTDFAVNNTAANWTVSTAANLIPVTVPSNGGNITVVAWPGIGTATAVSGKTVTFPSGNLTQGVAYCFHFSGTNTLTNASAGVSLTGTMHSRDNTGTPVIINETNYATTTITDDQVVVSAIVPPNFTFTISGNVDAFTTNLNPAAITSTTGVTFNVVTNAKAGWVAWVKSANAGLASATASYLIETPNAAPIHANTMAGALDAAPTVLVANNVNEAYVLDVDPTLDSPNGCSLVADLEYDGLTNTDRGGSLSLDFQPIVACSGPAPATSNGDTVTLIERAVIAGGTPAGSDYADTLTIVAAGNF